jgi:RNA-binding protein
MFVEPALTGFRFFHCKCTLDHIDGVQLTFSDLTMPSQQQKKHYRAIGHILDPIVTVAGKGLSETVITELNRALDDHELIKIRINSDRESRKEILAELVKATQATVIQTIGGIALILRASGTPNPSLSNLVRHQ